MLEICSKPVRLSLVLALSLASWSCSGDDVSESSWDGGLDSQASADGSQQEDGSTPSNDGGRDTHSPPVDAGKPSQLCNPPFDAVDTNSSTHVVGHGNAASCTAQALEKAVHAGGIVTFDCGEAPVTITVDHEIRVSKDTVIDGGGKITLQGAGNNRILTMPSNFPSGKPKLTVQHLIFKNGHSSGKEDTKAGGGAIWTEGGSIDVIDCHFEDNQGPGVGQDVAGGAIYDVGRGTVRIRDSVFSSNRASSGGAVGILHANLEVYDTVFAGNLATGYGGNPGNGGNGGAIYIDGTSQEVTLCGVRFEGNRANVAGGAVFRVSNDHKGPMTIDRCLVRHNEIPKPSKEGDHSAGGGMFLMGVQVSLRASSFIGNRANAAGALFLSGKGTKIEAVNSTFADNVAISSLAGGLFMSQDVTGRIWNCTLVHNQAPGEKAFAGATFGGQNVELKNTIVADSVAGNGWNPISCQKPMKEGGGNIQWPVKRAGGGSDDPKALCSPKISIADPHMGPVTQQGDSLPVSRPATDSPAVGLGRDCPPTDQLGRPRKAHCTSGAVEI